MNWSQAFARQAESDLQARETLLENRALPDCHALQHLQMACEKICKAGMIRAAANPLEIQRSHAYVAKHLPLLVQLQIMDGKRRNQGGSWIVRAIRPLARKIELLNPSVRDGGRSPQNCEYPWTGPKGNIVAPADHKFEFNELFEPAGVTLLKILRHLADDLQR